MGSKSYWHLGFIRRLPLRTPERNVKICTCFGLHQQRTLVAQSKGAAAMSSAKPNIIPWRERAFVTIDEAAAIVARSSAWVRSSILEERLEGRRITPGSPTVVSVASLQRLIAQAEPASVSPSALRHASQNKLTLVISNPH
jgi:hypothetical protein